MYNKLKLSFVSHKTILKTISKYLASKIHHIILCFEWLCASLEFIVAQKYLSSTFPLKIPLEFKSKSIQLTLIYF